MSFSPQMLRSRLAGSTEAADSITSTAHWILFHKRHAPAIAEEWASAVKGEQNKLPQIYIANEVIQQSKIKRKAEFVDAFSKVLPGALASAYHNSDLPTRDRIMRVIRVWRDRAIFTPDAQKLIEDAVKSAGESLTPGPVPADLAQLVKLYSELVTSASSGKADLDKLADDVRAELDSVRVKIDDVVAQATTRNRVKSPSVEPLPRAEPDSAEPAPKVEVYTAQQAQASLQAAANSGEAHDDDVGYADSDEEESQSPPEKKQKVETEVDPKLASFLASISGGTPTQ